ncbi:MAG: hypothetical protein MUP74_05490 [Desulfobacterales bacterium]|nr:hypothetical protein [Desulfobacterales bacterium]
MIADPQALPSSLLADDSFAAWCYDNRSLRELRSAFQGDADPEECVHWNLSALEWKAQVEMALIARAATHHR